MKPRHTAEQSTVKVNKSEEMTVPASPALPGGETKAPAAAPRRGFGGVK
jgi:ribonucleoside-diphosphate reductase alpha chain